MTKTILHLRTLQGGQLIFPIGYLSPRFLLWVVFSTRTTLLAHTQPRLSHLEQSSQTNAIEWPKFQWNVATRVYRNIVAYIPFVPGNRVGTKYIYNR